MGQSVHTDKNEDWRMTNIARCAALMLSMLVPVSSAIAAPDPCVRLIQYALDASALPVKPGKADGLLGTGTMASASSFRQFNAGLELPPLTKDTVTV